MLSIYNKIKLLSLFIFLPYYTLALQIPDNDLPTSGGDNPVIDVASSVLGFVMMLVGGLSILAFIISGILYLTSAGNQERMETAKKALIYAIIGIFAATLSLTILMLIAGIMTGEEPQVL